MNASLPSSDGTQSESAQPNTMPARSAGVVAAVPGLSMAHSRPHKGDWTFNVCTDGALCEIKQPSLSLKQTVRVTHTKRGKIKGFSRGSRGRLLKTVGRLRQNMLPVFVTLTCIPMIFRSRPNAGGVIWRRCGVESDARGRKRRPSGKRNLSGARAASMPARLPRIITCCCGFPDGSPRKRLTGFGTGKWNWPGIR